ncbi:thioredoxin family protein [Alkalicoccus saliphilus]|jgi:thioredoxin-like negative regulator of GroEL|uniref:Thioredoxin n=1 Tax=Alkalicoccus saliphilus TaxID=200989 RepID=A0A2T4U736_9BACI|nr:thioredoxin family protein [Alkalicoccus saliphilus]PTL39165.1 thioredoxin [Alkalicoccus saliphilus]
MEKMQTLEQTEEIIENHPLTLIYISREQCSVCHSFKPQLEAVLENYPQIKAAAVSADDIPEAASRFEVFTAPAVLLYIEGTERWRGARFIRREELEHQFTQWSEALE